ncbi:tRNA (adenosine(37)-N6)-threonylcarbamoyltransferase complex ATPase subunit type 1 TsaE [Aliikangiella sp. IMCC44653]
MDSIYLLKDEQETVAAGRIIANLLPARALIFLNGDLGAGKTTLVRGVLRAFGHNGSTKSPTYTLVEPYDIASNKENHENLEQSERLDSLTPKLVYHFDLYRLGDPEELEYIGIRDYLEEQAICLIEWPQKGVGFLPLPDLSIDLAYDNEARRIQIKSRDLALSEAINQRMSQSFVSLEPSLTSGN